MTSQSAEEQRAQGLRWAGATSTSHSLLSIPVAYSRCNYMQPFSSGSSLLIRPDERQEKASIEDTLLRLQTWTKSSGDRNHGSGKRIHTSSAPGLAVSLDIALEAAPFLSSSLMSFAPPASAFFVELPDFPPLPPFPPLLAAALPPLLGVFGGIAAGRDGRARRQGLKFQAWAMAQIVTWLWA